MRIRVSIYLAVQKSFQVTNFFLDYELVTKDNLVTTLSSWGEYFEVSLQIWVGSYGKSWSELLRFTATEKDCCAAGDRIPAIFVNSAGYIHVTSQVGSNGNLATNVNIKLKTWIKVVIKQYPENGKVILHFDSMIFDSPIFLGNL